MQSVKRRLYANFILDRNVENNRFGRSIQKGERLGKTKGGDMPRPDPTRSRLDSEGSRIVQGKMNPPYLLLDWKECIRMREKTTGSLDKFRHIGHEGVKISLVDTIKWGAQRGEKRGWY